MAGVEMTEDQKDELESLKPDTVRAILASHSHGTGRGASVYGLKSGDLSRGEIMDWLAAKSIEETRQKIETLWWVRIAGVGAVTAVAIGLITLLK